MFSLVKYLLESFVHFSTRLFIFLNVESSLYVLDISPFSYMCFADISRSLKLVFHSLSSPTHVAGAYFDDILFITFHFVDNNSSKNSSPGLNHYDWPLYFFLKVLCFVFGSITHLDWCFP